MHNSHTADFIESFFALQEVILSLIELLFLLLTLECDCFLKCILAQICVYLQNLKFFSPWGNCEESHSVPPVQELTASGVQTP